MNNKIWCNRLSWFARNEAGNVESALVLIPLLFLFLSTLQIAVSVMTRTSGLNMAQGEVSRLSLFNSSFQPQGSTGLGNQISSSPLTGGGAILISRKAITSPILTPLLFSKDSFESIGIAIDENQ